MESSQTPDPRKVFIIHGRNMDSRNAVASFLRVLGLEPLDFDLLAANQGGMSFIGDIVRAGLIEAHAIVALFTPDEVGVLAPAHRRSSDSGTELLRWQSRPNVIFEAGMAYSSAPKRTILATMGSEVSLFSDVAGVHILRLNNSAESRAAFRHKLIGVGASVDQRTTIWTDPKQSGDFESHVSSLPEVSARGLFR